jgi:glucokinase
MAMASYTLILDPQAIIIGGGVVDAGELLIKPAAEAMVKYMPFGKDRNIPQVLAAKFGNDAGLVGAANLARS